MSILKQVDAQALALKAERFMRINGHAPRWTADFEWLLREITTDDLEPAHRAQLTEEER